MRRLAGLIMLWAAGAALASPGADAVAFWTSGYAGAELTEGNFHCAAPDLPAIGHPKPAAAGVRAAILKWEQCHSRYLAGLRATAPESRIPADVLAAMTPAERTRARDHVQAVQARVAEAAQANAATMVARHAAWLGATVDYVARRAD